MISGKLGSSLISPNTLHNAAQDVRRPDRMTRFFKNKWVGKVCDTAADNPVITQSLFSLAICCGARPATNYATTPNKKDAGYASCHSISSGLMGTVWSLLIATPIAAAIGLVLKKPQKFLSPELIKKLYPNVGIEEIIQNGKKIKRVMTNKNGKMLRQNGTELLTELEPLKIKNGDAAEKLEALNKKLSKTKKQSKIDKLKLEKAELEQKLEEFKQEKLKFEQENPDLYVDPSGVVRSRTVFKTKDGKFQIDDKDGSKSVTGKKGDKIGCVVQADKTPVTEEMEQGINREQNMKSIINWIPDILLAPPRAWLTIKLIPPLLKVLGIEKSKKEPQTEEAKAPEAKPATNTSINNDKKTIFVKMHPHIASNPKKGAA